MAVRTLRMLRIFRVFKLTRYVGEANVLIAALRASRAKILVFLWAVLTIVVIVGALMYVIEGEEHGFTSIPTVDLLGDRDDDHGRLRRHGAEDRGRTAPGLGC